MVRPPPLACENIRFSSLFVFIRAKRPHRRRARRNGCFRRPPRPSPLSSRLGHHARPGSISVTSDWPTTEETMMAPWLICPSRNSRCCSRDDSGPLSYPLCNNCPAFFSDIIIHCNFLYPQYSRPLPSGKIRENTTLYFLLFSRLRAVSSFSLQSYCTRNLSSRATKPGTARNEGVNVVVLESRWMR